MTEMVLSGVKCAGHELSLNHCQHHGSSLNCRNTGTRFAAGVICSESERLWRLRAAGLQAMGATSRGAVGSAGTAAGGPGDDD